MVRLSAHHLILCNSYTKLHLEAVNSGGIVRRRHDTRIVDQDMQRQAKGNEAITAYNINVHQILLHTYSLNTSIAR